MREVPAKKKDKLKNWSRLYCTQTALLVLRRSCPCDDFDQLPSDNCLAGTIEKDLEFGNHVAGVFGCILRSVSVCSENIDIYAYM